jgi:predicted O-methyltransferase YrrM
MPDYEFTSDWFSHNIPEWQRQLRPLADQPVQALEIGSFEGRSALWLLDNVLTHPSAAVTCIDVWWDADFERRFDRNVVLSGKSPQVIKRKGCSWSVLRSLRAGPYDFIYIDGGHEASIVLEDAVLCYRLLKPGGLLCFDDYEWPTDTLRHHLKKAVDVFLELYDRDMEVLHRGYQVWARRKHG